MINDIHGHPRPAAALRGAGLDWRIVLGLVLTVGWLGAGLWYIVFVHDEWLDEMARNAGDLGSFLEGVFAPLAFLWLVLGHFLQQSEISANTRAIQMQERNTRRIELLSRRDSFFKLQQLVQQQLGSTISMLYFSIEGPTGSGSVTVDDFAADRRQMEQADYALFVRKMLFLCLPQMNERERVREYFFGTEIRRRHTRNYCTAYEKLMRLAREVDEDNMIEDALTQGSPIGRLYLLVKDLGEPPEVSQ